MEKMTVVMDQMRAQTMPVEDHHSVVPMVNGCAQTSLRDVSTLPVSVTANLTVPMVQMKDPIVTSKSVNINPVCALTNANKPHR